MLQPRSQGSLVFVLQGPSGIGPWEQVWYRVAVSLKQILE